MAESPMAGRRLLVDGRLHVATYDAGAAAPRWRWSSCWASSYGRRRNGRGFQVRVLGRVIEVIVYGAMLGDTKATRR